MRWVAMVWLVLAAQGCTLEVICTLEFRYGLRVTAWDLPTFELVDSTLTGILTDGAYREVMETSFNEAILIGAGERPGTFDIEMTAPGYRPWSRTGVKVMMDRSGCHVELTDIDAFMHRSGGT